MKIEGRFSVGAPRDRVWRLLNDPSVLVRVIPGCQHLDPIGPAEFEAAIRAGVAAIKGTYTGRVQIRDPRPPESYVLAMEGKGTGGFMRGQGTITLTEADGDARTTTVAVDADAHVGGAIAAVGQRLLSSAARMMLAEFFRSLDAEARRSD